jgi:hypothetical protein
MAAAIAPVVALARTRLAVRRTVLAPRLSFRTALVALGNPLLPRRGSSRALTHGRASNSST